MLRAFLNKFKSFQELVKNIMGTSWLHGPLGFTCGVATGLLTGWKKGLTLLPQTLDSLFEVMVPGYKCFKNGSLNPSLPSLNKDYLFGEAVDIGLFVTGYYMSYALLHAHQTSEAVRKAEGLGSLLE